MERSTNALTELANAIEEIKGLSVIRTMIHDEYTVVLDKAQRIVAELAKIERPIKPDRIKADGIVHLSEMLEADKNLAVEIVRNCRIIAREGVGDGK